MEASLTPPPGRVTRFAVLRDAWGSPARATLRETTAVWSAVTDSPDNAALRPMESVIARSYPLPLWQALASAFQVDENVHQLRAGLKDLGVCRVVALRFD